MRTKNNLLILDTETVGDFAQPFVHDLGYIIIDKDFNNLCERRFLISQAHNTSWALNSEFYNTKKNLYDIEKENGFPLTPWNEVIKTFESDIKKYKVKVLSAYNLAFDFRALNFTEHFLNNENEKIQKLFDKKSLLCIWNLACETILKDDEYYDYCIKNKFTSEKGNIKTNAETAYKYISNYLDFEEEHTALADVKIEKEILNYIIKNCHKRIKYGLAYGSWRKVQR